MYSIAYRKMIKWMDVTLFAKLEGAKLSPEYQSLFWEAAPLRGAPQLTFSFIPNAPLLDNYFNGLTIDLYSQRLVNLMKQSRVNFESFPALIQNQNDGSPLKVEYSVFHLLDVLDAIDEKKSVVDAQGSIKKIVLADSFLKKKKLLFRLAHFTNLVLIHQELIEIFEQYRITGFGWIPIQDFHGW